MMIYLLTYSWIVSYYTAFPVLASESYLQTTEVPESCNGWLFATLTIYWNSVLHIQNRPHAIHYPRGGTMHGCEHKFQEKMNLRPFFHPGISFVILAALGATATSQVSD